MRKWQLAAVAAVVGSGLAVPAYSNHSWSTYHWATSSGTLDVKVNAALTGTWGTYVDEAIVDWESSNDLTLGSRNNVTVARKQCSPKAREILVCNDAYGKRGWLGIASVWLDTNGHITQATTKLNDSYFGAAPYNTPSWRRMVTCQEIGHDFGLAHQDEGFTNTNLGSCMDYTNDPSGKAGTNGALNNEHPNAHDYQQLGLIYGHTDTYNSANASGSTNFAVREFGRPATPAPTTAPSGDSPSEWGRAIHEDGLGRPDVFERELASGHRVITHVFWTLETKRSEIHAD